MVVFTELEVTKVKNKKMDQEYSFALRPASIEEVGLFYSNDEQDEALGTVGHLRLDFGHGFLPLRSTCYPHNDDQFNTLEFKMLLREFLEAMQDNGPLASLQVCPLWKPTARNTVGLSQRMGRPTDMFGKQSNIVSAFAVRPVRLNVRGTYTAMTYGSSKFRKTVRWAR